VDNEYLYKLGVDASDLDAAINATISVIGELDSLLGTKMPRSAATFVTALENVRTQMSGVAADSAKVVAAVATQSEAFQAYIARLDAAKAAYKAFREDQLTGVPSGRDTFDPSTASDAKLKEIIATQEAATASVYQAAKAELAARQAAYEEEAAYHQSMQDAIVASAANAEQRRIELALNQAKAIEAASAESAQKRIADEQHVTAMLAAEQEAQLQKFRSMQVAFEAEQAAFNQGNAARYGVATGDNLTVGTTQTRNTAARNSGFAASSLSIGAQAGYADEASAQTLAAMRAYYTEQEKASASTQTLTTATKAANDEQSFFSQHLQAGITALPRLRYALYDVSTTLGVLGAGLAGVGGGIAAVATQYQADFASVARTSSKDMTGGQLSALKGQLVDLSTQIPVTFKDITSIATLGNQLNIPSQDITNFTKVVAQFAASSNLSVDAAGTAFGRLGQIFHTTNYQAIGDQIAYLGVKAVATESEIVGVAGQIAVTGRAYGLSQEQTLALATAYASLGVKAESARGSTVRLFADLQKAVVQGGPALSQLGDITGLGAKGFANLYNTDSNAALTAFLQGLAKYGSNTKAVLAELGITAQRDITNIGLLGQNVQVLLDAQKNVQNAGGSLQLMFDRQNNTVAGQLTIMQNRFQAFLSNLGSSNQGPLSGLIKDLNTVLDIFYQISKDPIAASGMAAVASIVTIIGTLLVASGVAAQYVASFLALRTMTESLGGTGLHLSSIWAALTGEAQKQKAAADAQTEALARTKTAVEALTNAQTGQAAAAERATVAQGAYVTKLDATTGKSYMEFDRTATSATAAVAGAAQSGLSMQDGVVVTNLTRTQALYNTELAATSLELAKLSGDTAAIAVQEAALKAATDELSLAMAQEVMQSAEVQRATALQGGTLDALTAATERLTTAQGALSKAQAAAAVSANDLTIAEEKSAAGNLTSSLDSSANATGKLSGALGKAGLWGSLALLALMLPSIVDGIRQMGDAADGTSVTVEALTSKILGLSNPKSGAQNLADLKKALSVGQSDNPLSNIGNAFYAPLGNSFMGDNGHQYNAAQGAVNQITTGQSTPGTSISYGNGSMLFDKQVQSAITGYQTFDASVAASVQKGDLAGAKTALEAFDKEMENSGVKSSVAEQILTNTRSALQATSGQSLVAAASSKQSGDAATKQAQAFSGIVTAAFSGGKAMTDMQKDMTALGTSFVKSGAEATINGGALQKVITQIYADTGGGPKAAAEMQGLFDTLVKGGFASTAQLKPLADVISALTHGQKIDPSAVSGVTDFYDAYNKAATAAQAAAEKAARAAQTAAAQTARTLEDYSKDIQSTITSMLEYQFGVGNASDKIVTGWDKIKTDAQTAAASVATMRADLLAINATKTSAVFALSVDQAYGDTTAIAKDQAAIAKANVDQAAKQKELAKAQDASSTSLTGNTAGAIANRAALEGQISSYGTYISALAESGASQKQIDDEIAKSKQQFIEHATQLGYNRGEVTKLAAAFDGMKQIINAIPRNITTGVTLHTDAASKALADYDSKLKAMRAAAAAPIDLGTPVPYPKNGPHDTGVQVGNDIKAGMLQAFSNGQVVGGGVLSAANGGGRGMNPGPAPKQTAPGGMDPWQFFLSVMGDRSSRGWASGGYTGDGGILDPAGIVHGQEFVLNNVGARMIPRAVLEAANQGRAPQSMSTTIVVGGDGGNGGGFTTMDKMFLAQVLAAKPNISISADQFGRAIDGANVRSNLRGAG
jgi:TP901 family phage tail tape measure protein